MSTWTKNCFLQVGSIRLGIVLDKLVAQGFLTTSNNVLKGRYRRNLHL